ncbi:hypothetical protein HJFPF1_01738 [Paramyrothecium foliicola]|nr:hypothetical protein HJFPF1_01738 [Paramyrothecium foliicola]
MLTSGLLALATFSMGTAAAAIEAALEPAPSSLLDSNNNLKATTADGSGLGNHLPFINLFNRSKSDRSIVDDALLFVKGCLELAKPVVIATYGHLSSYAALQSFNPMQSLQHDDYRLVDSVGNLHLRRYSSIPNDDQAVTIVIPSLHPGRVAYQGWAALDEALKRSNCVSSKSVLCAQIFQNLKRQYLQELQRRSKSLFLNLSVDRDFHPAQVRLARDRLFAQLRQANSEGNPTHCKIPATEMEANAASKVKWVIYSGPAGLPIVSPSAIWSQGRRELDLVVTCGFAWTTPSTSERQDEATRLYDKHIASILTTKAPLGDRDKFWGYDSHTTSYSISWSKSVGDAVTMENLPLPKTAKPSEGSEKRFMRFVPGGIAITDGNGDVTEAHVLNQKSRQAGLPTPPVYPTIPLASMMLSLRDHPHRNEFLNPWETNSGTSLNDALSKLGASSLKPDVEEPYILLEYYASGPMRALPYGDALWLLHEFLLSEYPQGGVVNCTSPAKDLTRQSAFSKLSR